MPVPWYDRWKTTPPEPKILLNCHVCDEDICTGDTYYHLVDGSFICTDESCLVTKAKELLDIQEHQAQEVFGND